MADYALNPGGTFNVNFTVTNTGNQTTPINGVAWVGGPGSGPGSPGVPGMAKAVFAGTLAPGQSAVVSVPISAPNDQALYGQSFNIYFAAYLAAAQGSVLSGIGQCGTITFPAPIFSASVSGCSVS